MELTFAKCESIVNTLPIGFYTGRRIGITLDKETKASFYDPMEDKIVVSYPIIAERMKQTPEGTCDDEEAVRSMLYHEVSHAILTPAGEMQNSFQLNCMEDERIETVLRHYYHGVNFRKQLYDIHGGHAPKAVDAKSAYFNAVRFGLGTGKVQTEVRRILNKYAKMNRGTRRWEGRGYGAGYYEEDIDKLWDLVRKEFRAHPEEFQPQDGEGEGEPQEMDNFGNGKAQGKGQGENQQGQGQGTEKADGEPDGEEDGEGATADAENPYKGEPHECELTPEEVKKMVGASLGGHPNLDEAQVEKLAEFQKTVEMIIGNFNKKNKGGSGINAYSGVFNPRAVVRKDYRFFERAMTTQGNNKFGTCHLNLIIDSSGSFCDNVPLTNGILAVLSEIERKNRNFTMDVAFINHDFHLCESVRERKMVANGGNAIPDNMKEILMKLQKPQTCNYNIVLFDGDAICQNYHGKDCNKLFGVFDMKQTTLITDPDNEQYMNPPFTSTKVVVTRNYTAELIDHIIHALTIAFG
jgi:hypothetical protein